MADHAAVKLYRDTFQFNCNAGYRHDIEVTVGNEPDDLALWRLVLENWGYWKNGKWKRKNKLDIKAMLSEYERQIEKRGTRGSDDAAGERNIAGLRGRVQWQSFPQWRNDVLSVGRLPALGAEEKDP